MGAVVGLLGGAGLCLVWFTLVTEPPRRRRSPSRMRDLLILAGAPGVSPTSLLAICAGSAVLAGFVSMALIDAIPVAVSFAILAGLIPIVVVQTRATRRRDALRQAWPEVLDDLISAVRAGMSLPDAVAAVAERGPEIIRPDFAAFVEDYRATGRFTDALDLLKIRLADPVADRIAEALRLTRDVGGSDLARLLRTLAAMLREDQRTRGELEARQSWTINGARLAVIAPWVILALLTTRPEAAAAFSTMVGVIVLATGAVASAIAYAAMLRLGRLPAEKRVLV